MAIDELADQLPASHAAVGVSSAGGETTPTMLRKPAPLRGTVLRWLGVAAVIAALCFPVLTFFILPGLAATEPDGTTTVVFLTANGVVGIVLFMLVSTRMLTLWRAKRRKIPGAEMHWRVASLFGLMAAVPAIAVGTFALLTVHRGLDNWFTQQQNIIASQSNPAVESYLRNYWSQQFTDLTQIADALGETMLNNAADAASTDDRRATQQALEQQRAGRGLLAAVLMKANGEVIMRTSEAGASPALPELPSPAALAQAQQSSWVRIPISRLGVGGAMVALGEANTSALVIYRQANAEILAAGNNFADRSEEFLMVRNNRLAVTLTYGAVLAVLSLAFLFAAIYAGLRLAKYMVEPINRLIAAARSISKGDMQVRINTSRGGGDLALLAETFNQMSQRISAQQRDLQQARRYAETRRGIIEAVLGSISAGVIGLNRDMRVTLINNTALRMFGKRSADELVGLKVQQFAPRITPFLERALAANRSVTGRIRLEMAEGERSMRLLVTQDMNSLLDDDGGEELPLNANAAAATTAAENSPVPVSQMSQPYYGESSEQQGYHAASVEQPIVVTLTDVTAVEATERSETWSEVARRIAHEIKNPLTPIQLAAERLQSRYGKTLPPDDAVFHRCTSTIIRQVETLGTMVNEFSSYTRLPTARPGHHDLSEVVRNSAWEKQLGTKNIDMRLALPQRAVFAWIDRQQIAQVITNLVNNAAESIERVTPAPDDGTILISVWQNSRHVYVSVADNGAGLPKGNSERLVDPYVTHRAKGTGLGLAIVNKIIEDHQGTFRISPIAPTNEIAKQRGTGAEVVIRLPRHQPAIMEFFDDNVGETAKTFEVN